MLRVSFADPDRAALETAFHPLALELAWVELPEVDWSEAWKAEHAPLQLSPRILVAPPWDAPAGAILIEPGQGFGTGQHPTTRLAACALDRLAEQATTLLDVGCGSGVLSLAGAQLGLSARGVDIESEAVAAAKANAARNGLEVSFSTTPIQALKVGAELVVANIHAEFLLPLASELIRLSKRWLVVCGIPLDREAELGAAFAVLELAEREEAEGWVCLTYRAR